ncbi:MAG TPA: GNAT family N-acetyltransferase, partial [Candidatus Lustribacter sp.]
MTHPLTAADFNMLFRGTTYGAHDIFTPRSFAEFVSHHQIDLDRAVTRYEDGDLLGALAFGIREDRAWFALIGVREDQRRSGVGKTLVAEAIARVRAAGVRRIELETVQRNAAAANMMLERGFSIAGELAVWTRGARKRAQTPPSPRA